jgi:hypothetical protein
MNDILAEETAERKRYQGLYLEMKAKYRALELKYKALKDKVHSAETEGEAVVPSL